MWCTTWHRFVFQGMHLRLLVVIPLTKHEAQHIFADILCSECLFFFVIQNLITEWSIFLIAYVIALKIIVVLRHRSWKQRNNNSQLFVHFWVPWMYGWQWLKTLFTKITLKLLQDWPPTPQKCYFGAFHRVQNNFFNFVVDKI